ncbi:class I SAM-dependent methyltransferase [Actinomadura terrae]|uniref:class I SAM-dependent methyltransferase n=1 Tax=Actinomadura terrae TaxID=604353 RepID=UPI001FA74042|nr:class I SAM-dependent methyltransferase [Actinomadura terrae]
MTGPGWTGTVGLWAEVFDDVYRERPADPEFDVAGWHSKITGLPFSPAEMREWVDATVARIAGLRPRRVVEIGCGSGLLMWRLLHDCESYTGTDISGVAVSRLRKAVAERGAAHVHLACEEATAAAARHGSGADLVILNSVAQYFPSAAYLGAVLDGATAVLPDDGSVFVGDVRNADLLDALHLAALDGCTPGEQRERRERLRKSVASEPELLVSPHWFARYAAERGLSVRAMPKLGRFDNELNGFRYDVVLRRTPPPGRVVAPRDWAGAGALRSALDAGVLTGFRGVPHQGVHDLVERASLLLHGGGPAPARDALRPGDLTGALQADDLQVSLLTEDGPGTFGLAVGPGAGGAALPVAAAAPRLLTTVPWGTVP